MRRCVQSVHMAQREHYIDRLRTVMTAVVLFAHAAMTYGGNGTWFYREVGVSRSVSSVFFTLFIGTHQAYLMGLFFLLAGYFTPLSLDRKGYRSFLLERVLRLGLPLLVFGTLIGPLTVVIVEMNTAPGKNGAWATLLEVWRRDGFINGPLWFAQALLIFSLGYCLWRLLASRFTGLFSPLRQTPAPVPSFARWMLSAIGVTVAAFLIRLAFPVSQRHFGLWIGYFASYIFLFAVGVMTWRYNWLAQLSWRHARPWIFIAILVFPVLPGYRAMLHGPGSNEIFAGGMNLPSFVYALWEPFLAWGIIAGLLLLFRDRANAPSRLWDWLGRRSYAVYAIHPPILVGISMLLRRWLASPFPKTAVLTTLSCIACWLAAELLMRIPGMRQIL